MSLSIKKKLKEQLAEAWNEQAKVNIGKNGLTENLYLEITKQLEQHSLIKVKFLQNYLTEDLAADIKRICQTTHATLLEKRGRTIILYKSIKKE